MVKSIHIRFLLVGIFIVLSFLIVCNCQQQTINTSPTANLAIPQNDIIGLTNFAQVSGTLYRGAQPTKEGFAELKKMGIKTIVNLRSWHSDTDMLKGLGLQYISIPSEASDIEENNVLIFLKVVTNPANQPFFVHCQHGSDRTGTMIAVYRIFIHGWSKEDAIKELANFGMHTIYQNIPKYLNDFNPEAIKSKLQIAPVPKIELID